MRLAGADCGGDVGVGALHRARHRANGGEVEFREEKADGRIKSHASSVSKARIRYDAALENPSKLNGNLATKLNFLDFFAQTSSWSGYAG